LIVDEPTRGVDIAAKRAIHQTLINLAKTGMAILFISSEIEEVLGVCDRVLVIHQGKVHAEFTPPFDQKEVVAAFFGQRSGDTHD
jgi:ABC-type sugar transport system ATPase subunit